jgi:hypothetical protein
MRCARKRRERSPLAPSLIPVKNNARLVAPFARRRLAPLASHDDRLDVHGASDGRRSRTARRVISG